MRLVRVADSTLLSTMCKHGEEVVSSDTGGLYLEVSPSCPAFHAIWEEEESDSVTHEVQNFLDRRSTRDVLLQSVGKGNPIGLRLTTAISSSRKGVVVKVVPGVSVACRRWGKGVDDEEDDAENNSDADNAAAQEVEEDAT